MKHERDIQLILTPSILEKMRECVKKASPNEACALVFGDIKQKKGDSGDDFIIQYAASKFECIESNKESPVSFLINDTELLNDYYSRASEQNLRVLSIFHSHPAGASPSGVDRRNMEYLDEFNPYANFRPYKNLIWTIMDASNYTLNGFIYFHGELLKINVKVE